MDQEEMDALRIEIRSTESYIMDARRYFAEADASGDVELAISWRANIVHAERVLGSQRFSLEEAELAIEAERVKRIEDTRWTVKKNLTTAQANLAEAVAAREGCKVKFSAWQKADRRVRLHQDEVEVHAAELAALA